MGSDRSGLGQTRPHEGRHEVCEIGFRAAVAGRSQEVQDAHREAEPSCLPPVAQALEARAFRPYNPRLARRREPVAG